MGELVFKVGSNPRLAALWRNLHEARERKNTETDAARRLYFSRRREQRAQDHLAYLSWCEYEMAGTAIFMQAVAEEYGPDIEVYFLSAYAVAVNTGKGDMPPDRIPWGVAGAGWELYETYYEGDRT